MPVEGRPMPPRSGSVNPDFVIPGNSVAQNSCQIADDDRIRRHVSGADRARTDNRMPSGCEEGPEVTHKAPCA